MSESFNFKPFYVLTVIVLISMMTACTAGDPQFTQDDPAGFWWGLWHGVISVITLVIHVFNENVAVYEISNSGGWYDLGFLLGVIFVWGGGCHAKCKSKKEQQCDKEWDEIGEKVEKKVMRNLKAWAEDDEGVAATDDEWKEISEKAEKKLKRIIREWAEKE